MAEIKSGHAIDIIGLPEQHSTEESKEEEQNYWRKSARVGFRVYPNPKP